MIKETHKQRMERKKRERKAFQDKRSAEIAELFEPGVDFIEEPELHQGQGSVKALKAFLGTGVAFI